MGVVGERKLQELIAKAEFEVKQGTPQDIASRGLWEACAEALEGNAVLEEKVEELDEELDNARSEAKTLQKLVNRLVDEDDKVVDEDDVEDLLGYIFNGVKAYAAKMDEKLLEERAKTTKAENELEDARARIQELEHENKSLRELLVDFERAGAPALRERVAYLEQGLRRLMLEAYKLRRGVL